ncbi:MAG TPA: Calx-beta domain-containing protein [Pyrinomonadaceae bacterium]|nr:Calx-beta domain-containing protein [Pyrinomonadaceae bacterium]
MRLTTKSARNALVAALMAASLIFALSIDGVVSSAQSGFEGDYDLSFGTNGYTVDQEDVDPAAADEYQSLFYTGELLPNGSIIAGGRYVDNAPRGDFYLRKFTSTGAVDTSFGTNGLVRTSFNYRHDGVGGNDTPQVLKVQPDGKIVFAGQCTMLEPGPWPSQAFGVDACVMRYNANGTLDQTFGGGTLTYNWPGSTHSVQLEPGKVIFQTGVVSSGQTFGTSGIYYDMAIQPDGKIVLVGETRNYASFHIAQGYGAIVVRLNPNGSLDTTFGVNGIARWSATVIPEGCGSYAPRSFSGVRLQPDGRIIAVGYDEITRGDCFNGTRFVVTRWTAAGQLETVKHIGNLTDVDVFFTERAVSAHLTGGGSKILVSGSSRNLSGTPGGRQKPTMVRLNLSNLSLDTTFGTGGIAQYDRVSDSWVFSTLYVKAIQPDGKILGTDNTLSGSPDSVVRFNPGGSLDQSFGNLDVNGNPGHGRARVNVTHYNGLSSALNVGQILVRPNGRINLVGYSAAHGGLGILRAVVSQQNTELPTYTLAGRVLNGAGVGVAGVTVNLSGSQSASKVTDASGNYSFANLPMGGSFTVTPAKAGLTFVPASKSVANLSADQLSVNFSVPSLSVNNITTTEGNTGETTATFTVKLTPASTQAVKVKYATANQTALAPGDYTALALTEVTFAPGETSKPVAVKIKGDALDEANETFRLLLSAPVGAVISDNEGVCTITDNDLPPSLKVNSLTVTEGNAATTATFTITLSAQSAQTVTVKYQTVNGTAVAPADYTAKALTTLTFAPFQTTKTVAVTVAGDLSDEAAESFKLQLTAPTNATIAVSAGTCTINDNDAPPAITINNATATEPDSGTRALIFTVKLSAASGQTVTVKYATANGTTNPAAAGTDYTAVALTTLTFLPGQTSKTVIVQAKGDLVKELNETFFVNLSAPTNATIADAQGLGTILNDD